MAILLMPVQAATAWSQPDTIPVALQRFPTGLQTFAQLSTRGRDSLLVSDFRSIALSSDRGETFFNTTTYASEPGAPVCYITRSGSIWRINGKSSQVELSNNLGVNWEPTPSVLYINTNGNTRAAGASPDGRRFWCYDGYSKLKLFTSGNTGKSWDTMSLGLPQRVYPIVSWQNADCGAILLPKRALIVTSNGGKTWDSVVTIDSSYASILDLSSLSFLNPKVLSVQELNGTYLSLDTGHTWTYHPRPLVNINILAESLWCASTYNGNYSVILRSRNRGKTWDSISYACLNGPGIIAFWDSLRGVSMSYGVDARTNDGGYSWQCEDTALRGWPIATTYLDADSYYGVAARSGETDIALSTDRGASWSVLFQFPLEAKTQSSPYLFYKNRFMFMYFDRIAWTDNLGKSYSQYSITSGPNTFLKSSWDHTVWSGNGLNLYTYSEQGTTWSDVTNHLPNYSQDSLYSFMPVDSLTGFAKTAGGKLFRSVDGCNSWRSDSAMPFAVMDSRHWILALTEHHSTGYFGFPRTSNAGATWDTSDTWMRAKPTEPVSFLAVDSSRWFYAGYYSKNAGATWQRIPGWDDALQLFIMDTSTAFGANERASLWRLDMPWYVQQVKAVRASPPLSGSPIVWTLLQNPFVRHSELRFSLKEREYIGFELFDVLGNRHTLPNSEAHSYDRGAHVLQIDLSNSPSGTYYLRVLIGPGEVQTIKLVKE